jgi:DNA-binding response OmpR family regulator
MDNRLVLVVDADDLLSATLKDALRERGLDVSATPTGSDAIEWLRTSRPHLVIVGSPRPRRPARPGGPAADGLQIVRRIRGLQGED